MAAHKLIGATALVVVVFSTLAPCLQQQAKSLLQRQLDKLQESRKEMDTRQLALAEKFARAIGQGRLYQYTLRIRPTLMLDERASLDGLFNYIAETPVLKKVSDMDAAVRLMKDLEPALTDEDIKQRCGELVNKLLVPPCMAYVSTLSRVFETAEMGLKMAQLAQEIHEQGQRQDVADFIYAWAHYHTCKLLALGDRETLADKIPRRVRPVHEWSARLDATLY